MGNAALKQHFVKILEQHAPLLVKDLPYEKLLGLSVLGASVTLQRLEIQEQVLENLGILVPFQIDRACLEEVELSLRGLQLQILARKCVLRCRLRNWDTAAEEMRRPMELPHDVSSQPLLMRCLSSLNVRVMDIEVVFQMNDGEAIPWNWGVKLQASFDLPFDFLSKTAPSWHVNFHLQDLRVFCARAEQTELCEDRGRILGPCDLRVETKGAKKRDLCYPDQCFRLNIFLDHCPHTIRLNPAQLGLFSRLSQIFVLWDALLHSLDLRGLLRRRIQELQRIKDADSNGDGVMVVFT
eukprot:symbB.v1.2.004929.t1/scaffold285.1/size239547/3